MVYPNGTIYCYGHDCGNGVLYTAFIFALGFVAGTVLEVMYPGPWATKQ